MPHKKFTLPPGLCICRDPNCTIPFGECHCGCWEKTRISKQSQSCSLEICGMPKMFVNGHHSRKPRIEVPSPPNSAIRYLSLTQGKVAIIDAEDYLKVCGYFYYLSLGYAVRSVTQNFLTKSGRRAQRLVFLHRDIMNPPKGMQVDHINGDPMDNRKCNLRICTAQQNSRNRRLSKRCKSGCPGVRLSENQKSWIVTISIEGKLKHLRTLPYKYKMEAIQVRREAEKKYYGEFALKQRR